MAIVLWLLLSFNDFGYSFWSVGVRYSEGLRFYPISVHTPFPSITLNHKCRFLGIVNPGEPKADWSTFSFLGINRLLTDNTVVVCCSVLSCSFVVWVLAAVSVIPE